VPVLTQFLKIWELLRDVTLDPLVSDRFVWKWSPGGKYSAYRAFFDSMKLHSAKELWRVKAPPHVKFFFWLTLHRRLRTAERRKRHGLQDEDACALCSQEPEASDHLLCGCVVTRELWFAFLSPLGLQELAPASGDALIDWWLPCRRSLTSDSRLILDAAVLLVSWCVWKERNNRTFNRAAATLQGMVLAVLREAEDWIVAGFAPIGAAYAAWSQI
jgi:hypothetical protein